jgi:hypothetical protein
MASRRLLRLRYKRNDLGFLSASLSEEAMDGQSSWMLRVQSPSSAEEFRSHLTDGSSMALSMVTRDGVQLRGDAYVSSISDGVDVATLVVLAGAGPLQRA